MLILSIIIRVGFWMGNLGRLFLNFLNINQLYGISQGSSDASNLAQSLSVEINIVQH